MEYKNQGTTICETCNTRATAQSDGVIRCSCPDKKWFEAPAVRADEATEVLLRRKGFRLAPCGFYYYQGSGRCLFIYSNAHWELDFYHPTEKGQSLKDFLEPLPDEGEEVNAYWLHIVESKSPAQGVPSTYTLALSPAPRYNGQGGSLPTVHHPSWEELSTKLSSVGVHGDSLASARKELDQTRGSTLAEVMLTASQIQHLGFVLTS
jgi:hypothetical protein